MVQRVDALQNLECDGKLVAGFLKVKPLLPEGLRVGQMDGASFVVYIPKSHLSSQPLFAIIQDAVLEMAAVHRPDAFIQRTGNDGALVEHIEPLDVSLFLLKGEVVFPVAQLIT